jgi:hypothetical protein
VLGWLRGYSPAAMRSWRRVLVPLGTGSLPPGVPAEELSLLRRWLGDRPYDLIRLGEAISAGGLPRTQAILAEQRVARLRPLARRSAAHWPALRAALGSLRDALAAIDTLDPADTAPADTAEPWQQAEPGRATGRGASGVGRGGASLPPARPQRGCSSCGTGGDTGGPCGTPGTWKRGQLQFSPAPIRREGTSSQPGRVWATSSSQARRTMRIARLVSLLTG